MADIFNSLKRGMILLIFLIALLIIQTRAQSPMDEYDGIPIISYATFIVDDLIYPLHYQQMDSMGLFGAIATDVFTETTGTPYLERYEEHGLKIFANQIWRDTLHNQITRYAESHYTVWEAEGTTYYDTTNGKATLYRNDNTTVVEGDTTSVKTTSNTTAGDTLIWGPGYLQDAKYRLHKEDIIYNIEYWMKIEQNGQNLPQDYLDDVVCTVMVTTIPTPSSTEETVREKEVTVGEFMGWGNWMGIDTTYNLVPFSYEMQMKQGNFENTSNWHTSSYYVQFKIMWAGLEYLDLYIDKIKVFDDRGDRIVNDEDYQILVSNLVQSYITDTTIVGWYGLDEPVSIDNYEPFRVINEIIQDVPGSNISLHAGLTSGYQGRYGPLSTGTHPLYPIEEFWLRAKPNNIHINMYNYHYPYLPGSRPTWQKDNISYVTDLNLARINKFDPNFAYSTQAGGWFTLDENCDSVGYIPTPAQINYHANLGLLYGAKELRLDPFFTREEYDSTCQKSYYRTRGLIDENNDTTANYNFFRFTLVPRLNGLFGKTLKNSQQTYQQTEYDALNPSTITSSSKFKSIEANAGEQEPTAFIDFGFFDDNSDTEIDYFMLVSRYYNNFDDFTVSLDYLTAYDNWNVKNYIDTTSFTVEANGSGQASYDITLDAGDAKLYSVLPVVKYGGELTTNDTISSSISLTDDMTIKTGAELQLNEGYTYTNQSKITLEGTGFITGDGYFDLSGNGEIVISSWDRSLFKGISDSHPKLIWGEHPTISNVQYYKIYRFKESVQYILIDSVAGSVTQYVDTNTTIITGTPSGGYTYAQYYVTAKYSAGGRDPIETSPSDTIRYAQVEGLLPQKMSVGPAEERFTYNLEQNYPNPFNPITSISYSLKDDGRVTIKIYDILGAEVKTLVNENKAAGNHKVEFDASKLPNGVYIYRMETNDFIDVKKMIFLK